MDRSIASNIVRQSTPPSHSK